MSFTLLRTTHARSRSFCCCVYFFQTKKKTAQLTLKEEEAERGEEKREKTEEEDRGEVEKEKMDMMHRWVERLKLLLLCPVQRRGTLNFEKARVFIITKSVKNCVFTCRHCQLGNLFHQNHTSSHNQCNQERFSQWHSQSWNQTWSVLSWSKRSFCLLIREHYLISQNSHIAFHLHRSFRNLASHLEQTMKLYRKVPIQHSASKNQ